MLYERDAPAELLEELREIDPTADVVYIGDGEWLVGRRWPHHRLRYEAAGQLLDQELRRPASMHRAKRVGLLRLFRSGFRPVLPDEGPFQGSLGYTVTHNFGLIREEFRRKWWGLFRAKELFDEKMVESEGLEAEREALLTLIDRVEAERSDHNLFFRGRRSVLNTRNWN